MIKIKLTTGRLPEYKTEGAACADLYYPGEKVKLKPGERKLFKLGFHLELMVDTEVQIRPRSGLALKKGITVLNSPGTIDSDYRGEVGVILINLSNEIQHIEKWDRIAQMKISNSEQDVFEEISTEEELKETERGEGGFGHTDYKEEYNLKVETNG